MNLTDTRSTRIAVFIDFDNVEIGVKTTIGGQFDIGIVLEAIKERGEIVTKVAYSDWQRVGADYSRLLTQHAIRMVQRNFTPGGDKNGADITMALDALEMCFTHDHINAFVIVGGDSDFISLVEKLKQYGRKVIVVGGRQFTSVTMQRNCHEFIAYENLVRSSGRPAERGGRPVGSSDISKALPIVMRALKVLTEREVTPQLGLLKSTLLQLDSTFSEREYGVSSFRDFMEKVAQAGAVTLKHAGRSMLVEPRGGAIVVEDAAASDRPIDRPSERPIEPAAAAPRDDEDEESLPASPMTMQDGIRAVQQAITNAPTPPRFPMYVRQAKQFLRSAIDGFDERRYGFASVVDLLRAAGKEGVLRIDRDRQGAIRIFPGASLAAKAQPVAPIDIDETVDVGVPPESVVEEAEVIERQEVSAPRESVEPEATFVAEAELIADTDEDDGPQPNVTPDGRPVGSGGGVGGGKAKRPARGGRKTSGTTRQPRAAAVEAQRHAKTAKPRARKRPGARPE